MYPQSCLNGQFGIWGVKLSPKISEFAPLTKILDSRPRSQVSKSSAYIIHVKPILQCLSEFPTVLHRRLG